MDRARGITVLHVDHASPVAAIPTAAGPRRLLETGLVAAMEEVGAVVRSTTVPAPNPGSNPVKDSFLVACAVAREVARVQARGELAVVLSGSCHTALGTLSGLPAGERGVVWFDAHADFNTPDTSPSGLLDGMTLSTITGRSWRRLREGVPGYRAVPDRRVVLVGARSLDEGEEALLEASDLTRLGPGELHRAGPGAFHTLGRETACVYLHVDLDALDPSAGRANAFVAPGGISAEALASAVGEVLEVCDVRAVGFASYDPEEDSDADVARVARVLARRIAAAVIA